MKKSIIFLILTLLLSSCAVSSLNVEKNNELIFKQNSKDYRLGESLDTKHLGFMNIDIIQNSVQSSDKSPLFYERVISDQAYEFSRGSIETLKIIFDLSRSNLIYSTGNILLIQLEVQNSKYVNFLVEKSGIQEMSYVYGYSNEEFLKLAQSFDIKIDTVKLKTSVLPRKSISKWSQTRLIIEPILQPFDKRGRF